jgi:hypothetical protein
MLGAGGFASEVIDTIEELNKTNEKINIMGFVYENAIPRIGPYGFPILGDFDYLKKLDLSEIFFVCAIGTPEIKKQLVNRAKQMGRKFLTIIHPKATFHLTLWQKVFLPLIRKKRQKDIKKQTVFINRNIEDGLAELLKNNNRKHFV